MSGINNNNLETKVQQGDEQRRVAQLVAVFLGVLLLMNNLYTLEDRLSELERKEVELNKLAKDVYDTTVKVAQASIQSSKDAVLAKDCSRSGGKGEEGVTPTEEEEAGGKIALRGGRRRGVGTSRDDGIERAARERFMNRGQGGSKQQDRKSSRHQQQQQQQEQKVQLEAVDVELLAKLVQEAKAVEDAPEDLSIMQQFEMTPMPLPPANVYETLPPSRVNWGKGDPNWGFSQTNDKPLVAVMTINAQVGKGGRGLASKSSWMYPMSFHNKIQYCNKWNYDLIIEDNEIVDRSRDVAWSKIPALKKWLPQYQWIMWMDMDAFFMRFDYDIEHILSEDVDFIIGKDWHGVNMGVFFIRNSPYSFELLDTLWNTPKEKWYPWEEQSALMELLKRGRTNAAFVHTPHFMFPPLRDFNAYPSDFAFNHKPSKYQKGDFIAHFPNCKSIKNCKRIMEDMFDDMMTDNMLPPVPEKVPSHHYPDEK